MKVPLPTELMTSQAKERYKLAPWKNNEREKVTIKLGRAQIAKPRVYSFRKYPWPWKDEKGSAMHAAHFACACMINLGKTDEPTTACTFCGYVFRGWKEYLDQKPEHLSFVEVIFRRHVDSNQSCMVAKFARALFADTDINDPTQSASKAKHTALIGVSMLSFEDTSEQIETSNYVKMGFVNTSNDRKHLDIGCLACTASYRSSHNTVKHRNYCSIKKLFASPEGRSDAEFLTSL